MMQLLLTPPPRPCAGSGGDWVHGWRSSARWLIWSGGLWLSSGLGQAPAIATPIANLPHAADLPHLEVGLAPVKAADHALAIALQPLTTIKSGLKSEREWPELYALDVTEQLEDRPGFTTEELPLDIRPNSDLPNSDLLPPSPELPLYPETVPAGADPELGVLQLREQPLQLQAQPVPVYAFGRIGYFRSDNAFSRVEALEDNLFQASVLVLATPQLSNRTALLFQAEGGLVRYQEFPVLDYTEVNLSAGIRHAFTPQLYGELDWSYRQLFAAESGDRFLSENSWQGTLVRRDRLAPDLRLVSYYRLRLSLADPNSRNRVINTAGFSVLYDATEDLEVGLNSQLNWVDFTDRDRVDLSTQILAQATYKLSSINRISLYSGFAIGNSTDPDIDLNSFIFGANVSLGIRLF